MSLIFSVGHCGGFYFFRSRFSIRIRLGWIAVTLVSVDVDDVFLRVFILDEEGDRL